MKIIYTHNVFAAFFIILLCNSKNLHAQITVTDNQTAQALAQRLVGAGVTMLNPTINCAGEANGVFSGNGGNMGIDSGIVLTSGEAAEVVGPNDGLSSGPDDFDLSNPPGDPDLDNILDGIESNDACVLEFDFIPAGDTVKFDYIFASTEYQGFSCSSFNDVFGFFISGPGYTAPYNMALIPNTDIPICVNSTTNPSITDPFSTDDCEDMGTGSPFAQYYVDNMGGAILSYGGFTTIFTAIAPVIPCDTFHLKLAIGDGTDATLDSGVFLKAGSLNSIGITVGGETGGGQPNQENHAVRGCKPGKFDFSLPNPLVSDLTIHYVISGTADAYDYEPIPDSIVIPAGETSAQLVINAIHNNQTNYSPETVVLTVYSPYLCGNGEPNIIAESSLLIYDSLYATPATQPEGICPGDSVLLTEELTDGLYIKWSPSALASSPNNTSTWVHPTTTTTFVAAINQLGAPETCPDVLRYFTVHVDPIPQIIMPDDDIVTCLADSINLPVDVLPADYDYTFKWEPAEYLRADDIGYNFFYGPVGKYEYTLHAYSPLGCESTKDIKVEILPPFTFSDVSPDTSINYGDQIQLRAIGGLAYQWSPPRWMLYPNEPNPFVAPLETITYTVVGINEFGCRDTADIKVTVNYKPEDMMPTAFSPNGDGLNDRFKIQNLGFEKLLQFTIFNRWGEIVYDDPGTNMGWDGTYNSKEAPLDVYSYIVKISSPEGLVRTIKGNVTLVR